MNVKIINSEMSKVISRSVFGYCALSICIQLMPEVKGRGPHPSHEPNISPLDPGMGGFTGNEDALTTGWT